MTCAVTDGYQTHSAHTQAFLKSASRICELRSARSPCRRPSTSSIGVNKSQFGIILDLFGCVRRSLGEQHGVNARLVLMEDNGPQALMVYASRKGQCYHRCARIGENFCMLWQDEGVTANDGEK
jgi:hypothetical protein